MKVFYKNTEISNNLNYVNVISDGAEIAAGTKFAFSLFDTLPEAYEKYILTQTDWSSMFMECRNLTTINTKNWNSSAVTDMGGMFARCASLTSLDVSNWNTSNVTNMASMFSYCSNLTSLDVSSFNTSNVTNMTSMFNGCNGLTSLDLSHFNTSAVTQMDSLVSNTPITSFTATDWNLQSCLRPASLFLNCQNLVDINISGWTFGSVVQSYYGIFENCINLETVDLSGWVFPATQPMGIFRNDKKLKTIKLKGCSESFINYIKNEITQSGLSLDNITLITA